MTVVYIIYIAGVVMSAIIQLPMGILLSKYSTGRYLNIVSTAACILTSWIGIIAFIMDIICFIKKRENENT